MEKNGPASAAAHQRQRFLRRLFGTGREVCRDKHRERTTRQGALGDEDRHRGLTQDAFPVAAQKASRSPWTCTDNDQVAVPLATGPNDLNKGFSSPNLSLY